MNKESGPHFFTQKNGIFKIKKK